MARKMSQVLGYGDPSVTYIATLTELKAAFPTLNSAAAGTACTVATDDVVTCNAHGLQANAQIVFDTAIGGIVADHRYFLRPVADVAANTFKICDNYPGSAAFDITANGANNWRRFDPAEGTYDCAVGAKIILTADIAGLDVALNLRNAALFDGGTFKITSNGTTGKIVCTPFALSADGLLDSFDSPSNVNGSTAANGATIFSNAFVAGAIPAKQAVVLSTHGDTTNGASGWRQMLCLSTGQPDNDDITVKPDLDRYYTKATFGAQDPYYTLARVNESLIIRNLVFDANGLTSPLYFSCAYLTWQGVTVKNFNNTANQWWGIQHSISAVVFQYCINVKVDPTSRFIDNTVGNAGILSLEVKGLEFRGELNSLTMTAALNSAGLFIFHSCWNKVDFAHLEKVRQTGGNGHDIWVEGSAYTTIIGNSAIDMDGGTELNLVVANSQDTITIGNNFKACGATIANNGVLSPSSSDAGNIIANNDLIDRNTN